MSANRTEGLVEWSRNGETYKTWYYTIGDPTSSSADTLPPLLVLHGGPGLSSTYLSPHEDLYELVTGSTSRRPVIFYDQIGGGQSTHLSDKPAEFWTPDLFKDELDAVLAHFGLLNEGKAYDILGHSWGCMLASDWASSSPPRPSQKTFRKFVFVSGAPSLALWDKSMNALLDKHPEMKDEMLQLEAKMELQSESYQKWKGAFYAEHYCKINPWPQGLLETMGTLMKDPTVPLTMLGPFMFKTVGSLKTWDITAKLSNISVPTLVIHGKDDVATDISIDPLVKSIKNVRLVTFDKSSHVSFYEQREEYMNVVHKFLTE